MGVQLERSPTTPLQYDIHMTKAIIYTRQSKHRDESVSHEIQETACRTYAATKDYEIVQVFTERGISGRSIDKRKEFQTAVQMIKDSKAHVLLIYRWTRFARNVLDGLITLASVEEEAGGMVECALEQIDRSAMGKFSLHLYLSMGELESNLKGEQWKEAQSYRLEQGLTPGGLDYWGYKKIGTLSRSGAMSHTGYEVIPETAKVIVSAMERVVDGHSLRSTALWLNENGHRTQRGDLFQGPTLGRRLAQPFLRGIIVWAKQEHPGAHEAIIPDGLYRKYLKAVANNKALIRRDQPSSRLIGLVLCDDCGHLMSYQTAITNGSRPNSVPYLRCASRATKGVESCSMPSVRAPEVENAIDWWMPRHWQEIEKAVPEQSKALKEIENKEALLETLQTKLTMTLTVGTDAGLTASQMADALRSIKDQIETTRVELDELRGQTQVQTKPWWTIEDTIQGEDLLKAKMMLKQIIRKVVVSRETLVIHPVVGSPWVWYLGRGPNPNVVPLKAKRVRRTKAQMLEAEAKSGI